MHFPTHFKNIEYYWGIPDQTLPVRSWPYLQISSNISLDILFRFENLRMAFIGPLKSRFIKANYAYSTIKKKNNKR